jgi:hypothetical protein
MAIAIVSDNVCTSVAGISERYALSSKVLGKVIFDNRFRFDPDGDDAKRVFT